MIKKLLAIIVLVMVASLSIAGCTSSTNSNQTANSASQAASTTASMKAKTANTTTSASAPRAPAHLKVLFFYETNCPYCQALEPHVTQLQKKYAGKVPVQSIENYASPLAAQYKVSSVPTLILLNNGREVGRWVNPGNTTGISAKINSLLPRLG